jgi:hypothetical protein
MTRHDHHIKEVVADMTRIKLVALRTVVLMNFIMADDFGFVLSGTLEKIMAGDFEVSFSVTPELLLQFSVVNRIPVAMIFLKLLLGP